MQCININGLRFKKPAIQDILGQVEQFKYNLLIRYEGIVW